MLALFETTVEKTTGDFLGNSSLVFLDLTNSQLSSVDMFRIPAGVLVKALDACRSRRNLAGRLA